MSGSRTFALYLALAAAALGIYAAAAAVLFRAGFPLDDAWIHQTYARNLADTGAWSFQQGIPSTGSTAPLWTLLLAAGTLIGLSPLAWNFMIGVWTLAALAWTAARGLGVYLPDRERWAMTLGVLFVFEWHLVWTAGSGMETLLFAVSALYVLVSLLRGELGPFRLGLLVGLAVWLRPDGITLAGPVLFVLLWGNRDWRGGLAFLAGLGVLILPYAVFNLALSGEVLPSTYFAKQAEYAALRDLPLAGRLAAQFSVPLVGIGILAVPGLLYGGWKAVRAGRWAETAALAWVVGTAVLYALRLPATYQHGRYLIPVIPAWLVLGLGPLLAALRPGSRRPIVRVLSRTWLLLLPVLTLIFYALGAQAFARDVAVIESEMVETAAWVRENLAADPEIVIAAHDIGALGYFGGVPLLDLAGLVSAEVIPILRDESALRDYLDRRGADYLVTLEGWYPDLEAGLPVVYRTGGVFSPALGGTNMVVYRWQER